MEKPTETPVPIHSKQFDQIDRLYRCCFWPFATCWPASRYVYVYSTLELVSLIIGLVASIFRYQLSENTPYDYLYQGAMISFCISFPLGLVVIIMVFVGLWKKRPELLLPHMVFQVLTIIALVAGIVIYCVFQPFPSSQGGGMSDAGKLALIVVLQIIAIWYQFGFLVAVLKCYAGLVEDRR